MQINLLPWRQQARKVKKKRLLAGCVASSLIAIFIIIIIHIYLLTISHNQAYVNDYLQNEVNGEQTELNSMLNRQHEKTNIENQLKFIISLYKKNNAAIKLLDAISTLVPENIFLNGISRDGDRITFTGFATTDVDVTGFISDLKKSPLFTNVVLSQITSGQNKNENRRNFTIYAYEKDAQSG